MNTHGYVTRYYRDGRELSQKEWEELFQLDLDEENKESTWDIVGAVMTDYSEGRDCCLNGHEYASRTDEIYSDAKELIADMINEGQSYELLNALSELPEEEAARFVRHISCVEVAEGKYILKDCNDH